MPKLPEIYADARFHIPPSQRPGVLVELDHDAFGIVSSRVEDTIRRDGDYAMELHFWKNFWLELVYGPTRTPLALHCVLLDEDQPDFGNLYVAAYNRRAEIVGRFLLRDHWMMDRPNATKEEVAYEGFSACIAYTLHYLTLRGNEERDGSGQPNTKGNRISYYGKVGDTFRYEHIDLAEVRRYAVYATNGKRPDEDSKSAGHKRQHDVSGHWRQYKSGKRVFVRAHKRGDPSLGTVTRVIKVT